MDSGQWRLGRRPGLDGLRGLAVLLVVVAHAFPKYLGGLGVVGVTLFFALSGFLITALLLEERADTGRISFRGFYVRRARRLLPALAPVLIAAALIEIALGFNPVGELIVVLAYVSNWATAFGAPMVLLAHTWSLAVEEQFYLLWPIVFAVAMRRRVTASRLAIWCVVTAAMSIVLRVGLWLAGAGQDFVYTATITRADALLLGCALAAAFAAGWRPRVSSGAVGLLLAVPVLVAMVLDNATGLAVVLPTLTAAVAVPVLVGILNAPPWLTGRVLWWLGKRSYALYLWHYVLLLPSNWDMWALPVWAAVVLSFVAAEVSWWLVERPFSRTRQGAPTDGYWWAARFVRRQRLGRPYGDVPGTVAQGE